MYGMSRLRSRQDIISDMLKCLQEPKVKTRLMYGVNLSYNQAQLYLNEMQIIGLIHQTNDNRWITTGKGRRFLRLYEEAEKMLETPIPVEA